MAISKKGLYSYVIDVNPSKYLYKDKLTAIKDAVKDWKAYTSKEMTHLAHIQYKDAVKQGIIWFDYIKVKT